MFDIGPSLAALNHRRGCGNSATGVQSAALRLQRRIRMVRFAIVPAQNRSKRAVTLGTGFWANGCLSIPGFFLVDYLAAERSRRPAKLPILPGSQPRSRWAEKNEIRIPERGICMAPSRLDVHGCRNGPSKPCARDLEHGQDMVPGW
jgi:hypothetical protein